MNSRGPKVRQAEPLPIDADPNATSAALATVAPANHGHDPHGLDPHAGRAQFALLALIGVAMFLGFGFLSLTGASTHPQGNYFLAALSLLGLSMSWFYGSSIRQRPRGVSLAGAAHIPTRSVLPQRPLDVQPTMRKGLRFVLAFFSIATAMFAHLTFWVALRSPNAGTVGAYVGALFISFFGVFTGAGAIAIARELRAKPRFGSVDRVERWCRVHEVRDGYGSALEPASRVFVIDHPRGGTRPLELTIAGYERAPWLVAGHALAVFSPTTPEDIQLVREDGSPFAISDDELRSINSAVEEPRNYRS
ncbi:MAG: hypothetical protein U0269_15045 [Polyangiales bacterium]